MSHPPTAWNCLPLGLSSCSPPDTGGWKSGLCGSAPPPCPDSEKDQGVDEKADRQSITPAEIDLKKYYIRFVFTKKKTESSFSVLLKNFKALILSVFNKFE